MGSKTFHFDFKVSEVIAVSADVSQDLLTPLGERAQTQINKIFSGHLHDMNRRVVLGQLGFANDGVLQIDVGCV
jgi:hypothetical protein